MIVFLISESNMTLKSLTFGMCLLGNFKWPVKVTLHFHYIYSIANYKHRQCLSSSSYNYSLRTVIQAWRLKALHKQSSATELTPSPRGLESYGIKIRIHKS